MNLLDLKGPVFLHEPPHRVEFSNHTGTHIDCAGHGSPQPDVSISLFYFYFNIISCNNLFYLYFRKQ